MPRKKLVDDVPIWDELVAQLGHDPRSYDPTVVALPFTLDDAPFFAGTEFDLPETHTGELTEETT